MSKPFLLFAYANPGGDIPATVKERDAIYAISRRMQEAGLVEVQLHMSATDNIITNEIESNEDKLSIFHFGGHSTGLSLTLSSGEKFGEEMASVKLAQLLKHSAETIKLVFLNGCANKEQVENLLNVGIPTVIATSRNINDEQAAQFSAAFYANLRKNQGNNSILDAFNKAKEEIETFGGISGSKRDLGNHENPEANKVEFPWKLYPEKGADDAKSWCIRDGIVKVKKDLRDLERSISELDLSKGNITNIYVKSIEFTNESVKPIEDKIPNGLFSKIKTLDNMLLEKNTIPVLAWFVKNTIDFVESQGLNLDATTLDLWLRTSLQKYQYLKLEETKFDIQSKDSEEVHPVLIFTLKRQGSSHYWLNAYFYSSYNKFKHILKADELIPYNDIRKTISIAYDDALGHLNDVEDPLIIEFFVEFDWLTESIDQFEIPLEDEGYGNLRLGHEYPFVIRSLNRIETKSRAIKRNWIKRWRRLETSDMSQELYLNLISNIDDDLEADLKNENVIGVGLKFCLDKATTKDFCLPLFKSGIPIMILPRDNGNIEDIVKKIKEIVDLKQYQMLPHEIFKGRKTKADGDSGIENHISILWDNPNRIPQIYMPPDIEDSSESDIISGDYNL